MMTFARSSAGRCLMDRYAGSTMMTPRNTGPSSVPMRNHLDRMRSRYSRLNTTPSLRMSTLATHSLLDASCADSFKEDLVQRRLHQFEALNRRAGRYDALQQCLRVSPGC